MPFPSYASGESFGFASIWGLFWGLFPFPKLLVDDQPTWPDLDCGNFPRDAAVRGVDDDKLRVLIRSE